MTARTGQGRNEPTGSAAGLAERQRGAPVAPLLCRALCQGAALHYLDVSNGVKDSGVWSSCAALDGTPPGSAALAPPSRRPRRLARAAPG